MGCVFIYLLQGTNQKCLAGTEQFKSRMVITPSKFFKHLIVNELPPTDVANCTYDRASSIFETESKLAKNRTVLFCRVTVRWMPQEKPIRTQGRKNWEPLHTSEMAIREPVRYEEVNCRCQSNNEREAQHFQKEIRHLRRPVALAREVYSSRYISANAA